LNLKNVWQFDRSAKNGVISTAATALKWLPYPFLLRSGPIETPLL